MYKRKKKTIENYKEYCMKEYIKKLLSLINCQIRMSILSTCSNAVMIKSTVINTVNQNKGLFFICQIVASFIKN